MQSLSRDIVVEYLNLIVEKSNLLVERNACMTSFHDYMLSPNNMEKFDAACMLIQVIGETARKIDNWTNSSLFINYPQVYWKGVFALRNIISHEYGNVDPENIFKIVKVYVPQLILCVELIISDIESGKYDYLFVGKME